MGTRTTIPLTPTVLRWAIAESGFSEDELISHLQVDRATLRSWMKGDDEPNLTQFRKLATILKRPTALFFLSEPPRRTLPAIEFRRPPNSPRNQLNPTERRYIREAARLQQTASWILQESDEPAVDLPNFVIGSSSDNAAHKFRDLTGIATQFQLEWRDEGIAFKRWRTALQGLGILVLLLPLGKQSSRGLSIWNHRAPVIIVNSSWNTQARIFTLFHEVAHLLSKTSSACFGYPVGASAQANDQVERWCEQFSAAFLLPRDAFLRFLQERLNWSKGYVIDDLEPARKIARAFKVSLRAGVIRLIDFKAATWDLYQKIPPWIDDKDAGGGGRGRSRNEIKEDQLGQRTRSVFVAGLRRDLLSRADVLSHLDVADSDLDQVEREGST